MRHRRCRIGCGSPAGRVGVKSVAWGVLSSARIGLQRALPGMKKSPWCDLRALASRNEATARTAADTLGIPMAYGSYEALLADPQIEAIYNPLPNHLHVPLTLQGGGGRQARAVREADRDDGARGGAASKRRRQRADRRGVHGPLPSAVAPRARARARRSHRRASRRADVLLLQEHRPGEHPQRGRRSAAGRCTTSAATPSSPAGSSSRRNPRARSR